MSDPHVSPSSTPPADHAPATTPGRVPSDARMALELREFEARQRTRALEIALRHADCMLEGATVLRVADDIARFILTGVAPIRPPKLADASVPQSEAPIIRQFGRLNLLGSYALRSAEGGVGSATFGVDLSEVGIAPIGHRIGIDVHLDHLDAAFGELIEFRLDESDERLVGVLDTGPADFTKAGIILAARPDDRGSTYRHGLLLSVRDDAPTVAGEDSVAIAHRSVPGK